MTTPTARAAALIRSLIKLPDFQAAIEALCLFLLVIGVGALAAWQGVLVLHHAPRETMSAIFITAFFLPALGEELLFRSWLRDGEPLVAGLSMIAFVLWHPLQYLAGSPFAHPAFIDPGFLALVAVLGFACTLSRLRSGSIWPGVIIHWGAAVVWQVLFAGASG
jgi:predicted Abi (CAAX) family protease